MGFLAPTTLAQAVIVVYTSSITMKETLMHIRMHWGLFLFMQTFLKTCGKDHSRK